MDWSICDCRLLVVGLWWLINWIMLVLLLQIVTLVWLGCVGVVVCCVWCGFL